MKVGDKIKIILTKEKLEDLDFDRPELSGKMVKITKINEGTDNRGNKEIRIYVNNLGCYLLPNEVLCSWRVRWS
jgi:hypothetical protein